MGPGPAGAGLDLLIQAIDLWAEAMTKPAREGGGVIDRELADMAISLFDDRLEAQRIGREVGDLMILTRGELFFRHRRAPVAALGPMGGDVFRVGNSDSDKVEFKRDASGKVDAFIL